MRFINAIVQWRWLTPRGGDFPGSHPQTWIWCTNKNTSLEKGIRLETRLEYHWIISLYFIVAFVSRELLIVACTLFFANSVPWFLCLNKGPRHGFQSYPMNTVFLQMPPGDALHTTWSNHCLESQSLWLQACFFPQILESTTARIDWC